MKIKKYMKINAKINTPFRYKNIGKHTHFYFKK
jgi:hypothetical protein